MLYQPLLRDSEYWNEYYRKNLAPTEPSPFARFVYKNYMESLSGRILELGCGNGRDSAYFIQNNLQVTSIDASEEAINTLNHRFAGVQGSRFLCGDFVTSGVFQEKFDFCYSRFSFHAITEEQENHVLGNIFRSLEEGGFLFLEARSVHDELYGSGDFVSEDSFIFDGHYRRFLRIGKLISKIDSFGAYIHYAAERKGFAPYMGQDPYVIRIIARK